MRNRLLIVTGLGVLAAACGGSGLAGGGNSGARNSGLTGPDGGGGGNTTRTPMQATVNQTPWMPTTSLVASYQDNVLLVTGVGNTITGVPYTVTIRVDHVATPGTYQLGEANVQGSVATLTNPAGPGWTSNVAGAGGSITLTTLSATRAIGYFSFDARPMGPGPTNTGSAALVRVTGGSIDLVW